MISVGLVGCGYWGPNLVRNLNAISGCKVKCLCDTQEDRLNRMSQLYPALSTTRDFDELIRDEDISAVVIATPVSAHYDMAKAALSAGKHVLVEKPMAGSASQCEDLIATAAERNLTLMVGHTFIYSAAVRKIKEIVDSRVLGEIQYVNARRLNLGVFRDDIDVAWDLAPHDLSIIMYILCRVPTHVSCLGKAHVNKSVEDITNMTLEFGNGTIAFVQSSWLDPNKVRNMTFVGTKKMLVYDDVEPNEKIRIYDKRVEPIRHFDTFADFQYAYHYGDVHCPYIQQEEPLRVECQHFLDCVKTGQHPDSGGIDGLRTVQILEAARRSMSNGGGKVMLAGA